MAVQKKEITNVDRVAFWTSLGYRIIQALIVGIGFFVGIPVIEEIISMIPQFILDGMNVAAGILPAVGIAMLAK